MTTRIPQLAMLTAATLWLAAACSSTHPPTEQVAVSTATLADAATAGGATWAPGEMTAATEKLRKANAAMDDKDWDLARTLAEQSQVDAQLAQAKVRSGKAGKAAEEVRDAGRSLRDEMNRKGTQ